MELVVVGAGVGRTGTHSLKIALEKLLDAPCHPMLEILGDPTQIPAWTDAIEGRPVDWMDAFTRHNDTVRAQVPADRLLEWTPGDGWEPICERLGLGVPGEPFPVTNTTDEFREMVGMPPLT